MRDMAFKEKLLTSQPPLEVGGAGSSATTSPRRLPPSPRDIERAAAELLPKLAPTSLTPDTHSGIPVVCRYLWSDINADSARWAQPLSPDDGPTWETNWVMELARTEKTP